MSRFEAETTIERAAADVWAYAADILRHPDWMTVADAHLLRGDGTQVGARGREKLHFGPFRWDVDLEVAEAEPGRSIVWRTVDDPRLDGRTTLELASTGPATTRATYSSDVRMRGWWRVLTPLLAIEARAGVKRELMRLKANLERGAGGTTGEDGA